MKFNGNYENHLDNKGRMIVPAKFRKILGKSIVVSLEFENALVLRTTEDFNSWATKINSLDSFNSSSRTLQRMILGRSEEIKIDTKGRINIPSTLLKDSKLGSNVHVIGVGDKIEILSSKAWKDMTGKSAMTLEQAAEKLVKGQ